jgi:hypothetical protein
VQGRRDAAGSSPQHSGWCARASLLLEGGRASYRRQSGIRCTLKGNKAHGRIGRASAGNGKRALRTCRWSNALKAICFRICVGLGFGWVARFGTHSYPSLTTSVVWGWRCSGLALVEECPISFEVGVRRFHGGREAAQTRWLRLLSVRNLGFELRVALASVGVAMLEQFTSASVEANGPRQR